jgi:hypothetical protein
MDLGKPARIGRIAVAGGLLALLAGCGDKNTATKANYCAPDERTLDGAKSGSGRAFMPDPIVTSGISTLAPTASNLDEYAREVTLDNLLGTGVLSGKYVDVQDGGACGFGYGAYSVDGLFSYPFSDARFQEAMTYYWGDHYRSQLDTMGYLQPARAVTMLANCPISGNALFMKSVEDNGQVAELVCLGYSSATQGAHYSDDALVAIHELQHATTTDTYNPEPRGQLNQLFYDEAGAMNEAISDFMALMQQQPLLGAQDPKLFSRWALGSFDGGYSSVRGAHRCPTYDSTYPSCSNFPSFSADQNTISYVYPDGVGWPYANNFRGPGYAGNAFSNYSSQEQIHNAGVVLEGALWDVYDAIKANHGGDAELARTLSTKLVLEALKHLPQPNATAASPVTFRGLAAQMVLYGGAVGLSGGDQSSMATMLTERGLLGGTQLTSGWAVAGPGNSVTPGLRIQDNPTHLKGWLLDLTGELAATNLVTQGIETGLNGKLDPGEFVAVWFDLQNNEATTAGGVSVSVTPLDSYATIYQNKAVNRGLVSSTETQVTYGKVNGTAIVTALTSANATYHVATGNTYFRSNPFFDRSFTNAIWIKVSPTAPHGATVRFQVQARPSNGAASTVTFSATIQ